MQQQCKTRKSLLLLLLLPLPLLLLLLPLLLLLLPLLLLLSPLQDFTHAVNILNSVCQVRGSSKPGLLCDVCCCCCCCTCCKHGLDATLFTPPCLSAGNKRHVQCLAVSDPATANHSTHKVSLAQVCYKLFYTVANCIVLLFWAVLQDAGFCVPQLESVCQVQSWQGEVELPAPPADAAEPGSSSSSSSSSSSAMHNQDAAAAASGQPAVPAWLQQVISQQQQQQQGQATPAAAAAGSGAECSIEAAAVDTGDAENAQALNKLGAVRRYNCMVAEAPPALLQFLDDAEDSCVASGAYTLQDPQSPSRHSGLARGLSGEGLASSPGGGLGVSSPVGRPLARRLPRGGSRLSSQITSGLKARAAAGLHARRAVLFLLHRRALLAGLAHCLAGVPAAALNQLAPCRVSTAI
jgi:hypothetical protein